ncbi:MAG: thiamine-phosphate kinase [Bacteroidales bacterium]|jgi:thiamine-monophosphate kinase|nr:thiamine-phosphate kinase [Bacteroidales bacterium]
MMTAQSNEITSVIKYKLIEKYVPFIDENKNFPAFASGLFTEQIDFDLAYFPLKHLGYKVIVATMIDILAMNGTPAQVRIDLALSNRFTEEAIDELMSGITFCCTKYNIKIVGLDFKPSATGLIIAASMTGDIKPERAVSKSGAKENELICVTGDLGSAYTGLILLERENKVFQADPSQQPDFVGVDYLLERYLKPEPPMWIAVETNNNFLQPTSMIALKNGLAAGLIQLCNASKLGCTIFEEKLPIDILTFDKLKELGIVATTIALNGGEDYELLFTIKQDDYDKIKEMKEVSVIGYMTAESAGRNIITNDNKQFELRAQGY